MKVEKIQMGNSLTAYIKGRVDSMTAPQMEKEVVSDLEGITELIFDFENLEYISSAGLRVLLKMKKAIPAVQVINVSPEVYEILDMTGFTQMLDVKKAFRQISVEGCEKIGEGGNGAVYRLDDETIVKVYRSDLPLEEINMERRYAKTAFVHGVPTAIAYDVVKVGDTYGTVYELMKSDTLAQALVKYPERWDELMDKYVALVRQLGETHVPAGSFDRIQDVLHIRCDRVRGLLPEEDSALIHDLIDCMRDSDTLIHGDLHPGNIMLQDGELMLIDMADMTVGPNIYELVCLYRDMYSTMRSERGAKFAEGSIGIPQEWIKKIWDGFITRYLGTEDPKKIEEWMKPVDLLNAFNSTIAIAMLKTELLDRFLPGMLNNLENKLKPNEQELRRILANM
jgi:uncharacterized protein (TIGR02172 family)